MKTCEKMIQDKLDEYNALAKVAKTWDDLPYVKTVVTDLILALARRVDDLDAILKLHADELHKK